MPEFLTIWDVIISIITVLIFFILYRVVQFFTRSDFYLSWAHLIKPGIFALAILLVSIAGRKTERVWYNLAYINNYPIRNLMMDWPTVDTPDTLQARAMDIYLEQRKAWPIALIGDPRKTDSLAVKINGLSKQESQATFVRSDTVYWDSEKNTLFTGTNRRINFDSTVNFVEVLDSKIVGLRDSLMYKNETYAMKINTWLVSDSLSVHFQSTNMEEDNKPME